MKQDERARPMTKEEKERQKELDYLFFSVETFELSGGEGSGYCRSVKKRMDRVCGRLEATLNAKQILLLNDLMGGIRRVELARDIYYFRAGAQAERELQAAKSRETS